MTLRQRNSVRLNVESLEDRCVPAGANGLASLTQPAIDVNLVSGPVLQNAPDASGALAVASTVTIDAVAGRNGLEAILPNHQVRGFGAHDLTDDFVVPFTFSLGGRQAGDPIKVEFTLRFNPTGGLTDTDNMQLQGASGKLYDVRHGFQDVPGPGFRTVTFDLESIKASNPEGYADILQQIKTGSSLLGIVQDDTQVEFVQLRLTYDAPPPPPPPPPAPPPPAGDFAPPAPYGANRGPQVVATGDFNRDGRIDLAVANNSGRTVTILLNKGNGTFRRGRSYVAGSNPRDVVVGYFNRDRKLDLAVASNNGVNVLLGNGNGTFQSPLVTRIGNGPAALAAADFNGDGKLDLAATDAFTGMVTFLRGKGTGTFRASGRVAVGTGPFSVTAADFNSDGKPDVAVANSNSRTVSVLLNNGTGAFGSRADFAAGDSPFGPTLFRLVAGDVNGDGKQDLVVGNGNAGTVNVLLGNGNGTFQPRTAINVGSVITSVFLGDLNGDGKLDLAAANAGFSNSVEVLLGDGTGAFVPSAHYGVGSNPQWVTGADLNGDGNLDLATADFASDSVTVLLNRS